MLQFFKMQFNDTANPSLGRVDIFSNAISQTISGNDIIVVVTEFKVLPKRIEFTLSFFSSESSYDIAVQIAGGDIPTLQRSAIKNVKYLVGQSSTYVYVDGAQNGISSNEFTLYDMQSSLSDTEQSYIDVTNGITTSPTVAFINSNTLSGIFLTIEGLAMILDNLAGYEIYDTANNYAVRTYNDVPKLNTLIEKTLYFRDSTGTQHG